MTTKEKIKTYVVVDQLDKDVSYVWNAKINRETENNNALIKATPIFMHDIQQKNAELTTARAIKQFVCEKLGIDYIDAYDYYSNVVQAKTDTTETEKPTYAQQLATHLESDREKIQATLRENLASGKQPQTVNDYIKSLIATLPKKSQAELEKQFLPQQTQTFKFV